MMVVLGPMISGGVGAERAKVKRFPARRPQAPQATQAPLLIDDYTEPLSDF